MPHVRKSIRDAIAAALNNLTTTQTRVFVGRVYPLESADDLPGLLVYTGDEDLEIKSLGVNRLIERQLEVTIEAVFQDLASLDDKGDTILAEVETALGPGLALGGLKSLQLARIEHERSDDGEKPTERMRMIFRGSYYTAHGAPTTAL
jgi:hypothetical protein